MGEPLHACSKQSPPEAISKSWNGTERALARGTEPEALSQPNKLLSPSVHCRAKVQRMCVRTCVFACVRTCVYTCACRCVGCPVLPLLPCPACVALVIEAGPCAWVGACVGGWGGGGSVCAWDCIVSRWQPPWRFVLYCVWMAAVCALGFVLYCVSMAAALVCDVPRWHCVS